MRTRLAFLLAAAAWLSPPAVRTAVAQAIDMSQGGSVTVTALDGINWDQKAQTVTAVGQARAVRGNVTVDADRLIAFYRKKQVPPGTVPAGTGATPVSTAGAAGAGTTAGAAGNEMAAGAAGTGTNAGAAGTGTNAGSAGTGAPDDTGDNEIYRLEAIGHVHIYTATDQAWGDQALYDIDQSVLVLTGHGLRLVTPNDVITARDSLEYWPQKRMSVARGNAVLVTSDARRIQADVLVGFSSPNKPVPGAAAAKPVKVSATTGPGAAASGDPLQSSGKLERAEGYGNVVVRTPTETVRGSRGVYVAASGIARILGDVHITRGQNQLDGQAAIVNMRTGLATLTNDPGSRVQGLIVPNDQTAGSAAHPAPAGPAGHAAPAGAHR